MSINAKIHAARTVRFQEYEEASEYLGYDAVCDIAKENTCMMTLTLRQKSVRLVKGSERRMHLAVGKDFLMFATCCWIFI